MHVKSSLPARAHGASGDVVRLVSFLPFSHCLEFRWKKTHTELGRNQLLERGVEQRAHRTEQTLIHVRRRLHPEGKTTSALLFVLDVSAPDDFSNPAAAGCSVFLVVRWKSRRVISLRRRVHLKER